MKIRISSPLDGSPLYRQTVRQPCFLTLPIPLDGAIETNFAYFPIPLDGNLYIYLPCVYAGIRFSLSNKYQLSP